MPRPLVVRLCNYIGDVVLGLPAMQLLAQQGYDLHLYGAGWAENLLAGTGWSVTIRAKALGARVTQLRELHARLSAHYGEQRVMALTMPNSFSSALDLRLAGFAVAGFARDGRGWLLKHRLTEAQGPHAAESFWAQACGLLGQARPMPPHIQLPVSQQAQAQARALIQAHAGPAGRCICIAPFAGGLVDKMPKRWPEFPALVQDMLTWGLPVLVCPGAKEVEEARQRYAGTTIIENLPLDAYAALLGQSQLVVANDTGPGHLAAAAAAPLISVLGPTKVRQWRPWGPTVVSLGGDGHWPTLDEVKAAARSRLGL